MDLGLNMRTLFVGLLVLPLTACSLATISNATIVDRTGSRIKVLLVTDKPLSGMDGSWCVDHVYLSYRVDPSVITRNLNTKAEEWKLPFVALERNYLACPLGISGHCSEWSINIANETSIDNISYQYRLSEQSSIQFQLGGGNMLGCVQRSNVYSLDYK